MQAKYAELLQLQLQTESFKMAKKSFAVSLVILVVVAALMVTMSQAASVNTGSVGNLKEFTKRSENSSEMTLEEATKTCNQSFEIKMGLFRRSLCQF